MIDKFSKAYSYIFQPLIVPTLVFWLMFNFYPLIHVSEAYQHFLLLLSVLFTFVFPAFMLIGMYRLGWIGSMDIRDRKERIVPYLVTVFFYGIMLWLMYQKDVHVSYLIPVLSMIFSIIVATIITLFWKVSAHLVAYGGLLGLLCRLSFNFYSTTLVWVFILSILLTGILMFVRIQLKAHTLAQVYVGFLLGFMVSYLSSYLIF